jgi:HAD superfamily hydrolase (TIGR01509 family)
MPRVILWDLMDTLIRDPFYTHVPAFFGLSFEQLLAQKHGSAWGEFELGRIDEAALFAGFFKDGRAFDGPALKRCMIDNAHWIDGIPELLAELRARGVPMHVLSNYSPWYRDYDARLRISDYAALSFVSCHTGHRKPSAEAFLVACRQLEVTPAECLFIDDRAANVQAAVALGMSALHFGGDVAQLRIELAKIGRPVSPEGVA